jgi:hypothetical protein
MLLSSPLLLFFVHFTSVLAFLCLFSLSFLFISLVPSVSLCSCSSWSLSVFFVCAFLYYLFVVLPFYMAFVCSSWFFWVRIWLVGSTTYSEGKLKFPFAEGRSQVSLSSLCLCSPPASSSLCVVVFRGQENLPSPQFYACVKMISFIHEYFHGNNCYETMHHLFNFSLDSFSGKILKFLYILRLWFYWKSPSIVDWRICHWMTWFTLDAWYPEKLA